MYIYIYTYLYIGQLYCGISNYTEKTLEVLLLPPGRQQQEALQQELFATPGEHLVAQHIYIYRYKTNIHIYIHIYIYFLYLFIYLFVYLFIYIHNSLHIRSFTTKQQYPLDD